MTDKSWFYLHLFIAYFFIHALFSPAAYPFMIPEKFVYDLTWTGIKAGTASLEVLNNGDKIKIISTAQSAKWVSVFYTVDDRIESTLIKNEPDPPIHNFNKEVNKEYSDKSIFTGKPLNYKMKIREGRHRRNKEVIFDHKNGKALYIDYLSNEKKEFSIPSFIYDPLSSFFYLRTLKLSVGEPAYVNIFDSKKVWNVEVQVLRKEKITIPAGTFNTIVVKPLMKSEGIFYRKGEIFIWLTDDEKHIPVKMQTKVVVGNIVATLVQGNY